MNNCCCAELVVDEGQQIELNVESDGGIEVGVAEQFVIGGGGNYQDKTVNFTPTESAQSQTVRADVGYDALDEVEVNVAAVSDTYVGSAVPRRSVADLDLTGAKFTAPAGYYSSDADKTMTTGHMSVSATKGTVSNHSVAVTPKAAVDNAGYFATGDRTGTAVSVSASELVSGSETKTQNGTYDVTNLAELVVNVSGQTPTGTKNISITANGTTTEDVAAYANAQITANVPNSYTAGDEGKVVDNGALVSQTSDTVTANDTYDTTLINSLTVNVASSGAQYKSGTITPTADWNTTTNHQICTVTEIGFTPKKFILRPTSRSDVSGVQYAMIYTIADDVPFKAFARYSNTTGSIAMNATAGSWTTQTNAYLYLNNNTVYYRTTNQSLLKANVGYTWEAYG